MKNFLSAVLEQTRPLSQKLLISTFMAGYLLGTLLFAFYKPQIRHMMDIIF
jgi:hypothetical protein